MEKWSVQLFFEGARGQDYSIKFTDGCSERRGSLFGVDRQVHHHRLDGADHEREADEDHRKRDPEVAARYAERYPAIKLFDIQTFGGWAEAQARYFADGGLFDRIYTPGK